MKDGARCSRIPPFIVSSRAMNERPSLRNSREHTVSSSSSTARSKGVDFGFGGGFGFAAFLGFGFGFALAGFFGFRAGFFGLAALFGFALGFRLPPFVAFRATGPVSAEGIKAFRSRAFLRRTMPIWVRPFLDPGKVSPAEATALSSRCVRLAPGERVGEHSTEGREEILLVLEGEATLLVGGERTAVPAGHAAFVPPETNHDVANEGRAPLTYVYVTARIGRKP